ncbi:hypothetical protein GCM10010307_45430 [Streptomyces vastus]|uniref:Uncharacterized protein n=1 Tax=Streptomyces vastus TaxID=285451 RepID=A0ABP6DDR1_9ACTN
MRDPGATTTYGVGELISAALDTGVRRILVGCGDSGTSDGAPARSRHSAPGCSTRTASNFRMAGGS